MDRTREKFIIIFLKIFFLFIFFSYFPFLLLPLFVFSFNILIIRYKNCILFLENKGCRVDNDGEEADGA